MSPLLDEEGKTFRNIIEGLSIQNRKPDKGELESEDYMTKQTIQAFLCLIYSTE